MNRFDVTVLAIRRRRDRRRPFEVRWKAAGQARSKSFLTMALADSYRAEIVLAARKGQSRAVQPPPLDDRFFEGVYWVGCAARFRVRAVRSWSFSAQPPAEPGWHLSVHPALQ
jgi:hypothetical protein